MNKLINVFKEIFQIIYNESKVIIIIATIGAILLGLSNSIVIWVNSKVINLGLEVAQGKITFNEYIPYLILLVVCMILPQLLNVVEVTYVQPMSEIIFRSAFKGKMLQKLKLLKYAHFENEKSIEIIDKAYNRAEEGALHLFPKYYYNILRYSIASIGILYLFIKVSPLFLLTIFIPFGIEVYLSNKNQFNIYEEMDSYWGKEWNYRILGDMLKSKEAVKENDLFSSSDYLIETYKKRLHKRNKEFEKFYFLNFKKFFFGRNVSKIAQLGNGIFLLYLYLNGSINIGELIALTLAIFSYLWEYLDNCLGSIKYTGHHLKAFDYYYQYLKLDEDDEGKITKVPSNIKIEFKNVTFTYPNTNKKVLDNVSFIINENERVSLVGANGEGKSTIIKLLLGLFEPNQGEILINDKSIFSYSKSVRESLFGVVFQDFNKYNLTLEENITLGCNDTTNKEQLSNSITLSKVDSFLKDLPFGNDTILGRDFDNSIDLSEGQWQRIAMARVLYNNKPILILDEPTSKLDPMAESQMYSEFFEISKGKTTLFITHRLGSTVITDRTIVLSSGKIVENGTSDELIKLNGVFANMWNTQKQWYNKEQRGEQYAR